MPVAPPNWDRVEEWTTNCGPRGAASLTRVDEDGRRALRIDYGMPADAHGYVEFIYRVPEGIDLSATPFTFKIKAQGTGILEIKFIDSDGSVFGRKLPLEGNYAEWTRIVMDLSSVEYWWGGADGTFADFQRLMLVPAGQGASGTVWCADIGVAAQDEPATIPPAGPVLDPDRELPGFGVRQRRDAELVPADPLVLEWMKYIQDTTTPAKDLLGTLEDTNIQTFNNALLATAFLLEGERERAERILDFFASAVDRENQEQFKQNLFYNGEARGFFQNAYPVERDGKVLYYADEKSDRWMGDMVWLMYAFKYHDKLYNTDRYTEIEGLILDLIMSWYKELPDGQGAYVQHGWRKGDAYLHEDHGHHEGNIDCHAFFRLLGMQKQADQVKTWLEIHLQGTGLPLDLYTWRALAYAPEGSELLDVCDYDFRYRKTVPFNGHDIVGTWHSPDIMINNIWVDGVGHIACAYFATGNEERGNFYANQMDLMLLDRRLGGRDLRAVPYALNSQGGFGNMDIGLGSASPAAWYIFAKHRFNPMLLETATPSN